MIDFLSLYFLKKFSLNALDKVENRSTLINKTLCHFAPPVCQNDTVYKLSQNLLYHYFFLFCNKRIRQLCYFVLRVSLYIYRFEIKFESKSRFLFYNLAGRFSSLGFYGHSIRNDSRLFFAKSVCAEPFRLWVGRGNRKINQKEI